MERGDEVPYGHWWMTPEEQHELERLRLQNQKDREAFNADIWARHERIQHLVFGKKT